MPPTRSDIRESRRKRLLNTRPVPANRPTWDAEWLDKVIPASELGKPFKDLYAEDNEIEVTTPAFFNLLHIFTQVSKYDLPLDITIPTPTDARPPPLKLSDLECLKTLGESHCKVLLVRSTRKSHRFDSDYPFALKAIPRKHVRENAVRLALEVSNSNQEISQAQKTYLLKSHKKEKEGEISILAKLNWHPFITGLINTFHDSQNLYLGLEYAPHGTLRSLLQQGRMNPRDANFYFANILAAVDFLHIQGIVHRDVKPENILLNSDGYLCLTDFGSACWLDAIDDDFPNMCGTRAYTAPEWHETDLDPRLLDWWSCGCILFEMATGKVVCTRPSIVLYLTNNH